MQRHQLLTKNILFNFIGLGLPMVVAVFTIPLLIRTLGTERFGILTLLWIVIGYASLFDLGIGRALTQQLSARLVKDPESAPLLVWTALFGLSILGLAGGIIIYLASPWLIHHPLHVPANFSLDTLHAFYIMAVSLPCIIATDGVRGVLESHQQFFLVNIVRIPMGIFTFAGPLIAVTIHNSLSFIAIFLAVGKILNFLLYFYFCFRVMPRLRHRIIFNREDIAPLFKMGGWTTVSNVISPLIGYLDRFFIAGISLTAVAYYTTPNEMITKLWLIPGAITAVFFPEFAATYISNKQNLNAYFLKAIKYIFLILFPIILFVFCFSYQILDLWLGDTFAIESYRVLQLLALGVLINSTGQVPFCLIQATGRAHLTAKILTLELPCYFLAMLIGIKYGNIEIIAFIWLLRMILDTALMFMTASKFIKLQISTNILILISLILLTFAVGFLLNSVFARTLVFMLMLMIIYSIAWIHFFSENEKEVIKNYCRWIYATR